MILTGSRPRNLTPVLMVILGVMTTASISCSPASSALSIFAAAGAKLPLDEICQKYRGQCATNVAISYSGGGEVLNQMVLSRSGDIYIAPEQHFMKIAREKQAIYPETVRSIAFMIPVIAVPRGNPKNITGLTDLARPGVRVAITRPETTLLGIYTPEIFAKAGLAGSIDENIVTAVARPDNLLTLLAMRQVDAIITWHFYQSQASEDIEIIFLTPEQLTGIGEMQIAVATYSQDRKAAQQFIDFIISAEGKTVFKQFGYLVDAEEVKKYWP